MDPQLIALLRRLPKAELHLHLEGCIGPALLLELSRRHGAPFGITTIDDAAAVFRYDDFRGFLQSIKTTTQNLLDPEDYATVVLDMCRRLVADGVVYAEVFLSVGILHLRKVPVEPVWRAVERARAQAEGQYGLRLAWIFDGVRQFGPEHVGRVVDEALLRMSEGPVIGIGIGGDEVGGPASWFEDSYQRAARAGLRLTAHAGESCGPESIWSAVKDLRAERIGHGLNAIRDPELMRELASLGVFLDICPTSNVRTHCLDAFSAHPARTYYDRRVNFSVATDDPAIFDIDLIGEYARFGDELGFTAEELIELVRQSFRGSFLSEAEKSHWLEAVDAELVRDTASPTRP